MKLSLFLCYGYRISIPLARCMAFTLHKIQNKRLVQHETKQLCTLPLKFFELHSQLVLSDCDTTNLKAKDIPLCTNARNTNCMIDPKNSEDGFHTGCRNGSNNQQQPFSGLHQPRRSTNYKHCRLTWIKPTTAFSGLHQPGRSTNYKHCPFQDYTSPDDQPTTNIDSPGSPTNNSPSQNYTSPDDQPLCAWAIKGRKKLGP